MHHPEDTTNRKNSQLKFTITHAMHHYRDGLKLVKVTRRLALIPYEIVELMKAR